MTEESKQVLEKITRMFQNQQNKPIGSFDEMLLQQLQQPVKGTSEEKYHQLAQLLTNISVRIRKTYMEEEKEFPKVLKEIDEFFDKPVVIPPEHIQVNSYNEKVVTYDIKWGVRERNLSCIPDQLMAVINDDNQNCYKKAIPKVLSLITKALPYLPDSVLKWHHDPMVSHV